MSSWFRFLAAAGLACGASALYRLARLPVPSYLEPVQDPQQQQLYG